MLLISNLFAIATKNNTPNKTFICGKCDYVNNLYTYIFVQTHKNIAFDQLLGIPLMINQLGIWRSGPIFNLEQNKYLKKTRNFF